VLQLLHLVIEFATSHELLDDVESLVVFKPLNDFDDVRVVEPFVDHYFILYPFLKGSHHQTLRHHLDYEEVPCFLMRYFPNLAETTQAYHPADFVDLLDSTNIARDQLSLVDLHL
jgi:hypothetical protein